MKTCVDCARSIDDRHGNAYLCRGCARARVRAYRRRRSFDLYRGPQAAAQRAYKASYARRKRAERVLAVVACADGCGRTFTQNRIGRKRQFHLECAAFYDGYKNVAKYIAYRQWKNAKRRHHA